MDEEKLKLGKYGVLSIINKFIMSYFPSLNESIKKIQREQDERAREANENLERIKRGLLPNFTTKPYATVWPSSGYDDSSSSDYSTTTEEEPEPKPKPKSKPKSIKKVPVKKTPIKTTTKNEKSNDTKKNIIINNYVVKTEQIKNDTPIVIVKNESPQIKYTLAELRKYNVSGLKELCIKNNITVKKGATRTDYETILIGM